MQTTMRVWDVLFNEGANILFRVALAVFKVQGVAPYPLGVAGMSWLRCKKEICHSCGNGRDYTNIIPKKIHDSRTDLQRFASKILRSDLCQCSYGCFSEGLWVLIQFAYGWQIKEEELVLARHVGEAIKILQEATHCFYDPEELLKVPSVSIL